MRQKIQEYKPIRVFLADNKLTQFEVKMILRGGFEESSMTEDFDLSITYVDGLVPQKVACDSLSNKEFGEYSEGVREAISIVRQILVHNKLRLFRC